MINQLRRVVTKGGLVVNFWGWSASIYLGCKCQASRWLLNRRFKRCIDWCWAALKERVIEIASEGWIYGCIWTVLSKFFVKRWCGCLELFNTLALTLIGAAFFYWYGANNERFLFQRQLRGNSIITIPVTACCAVAFTYVCRLPRGRSWLTRVNETGAWGANRFGCFGSSKLCMFGSVFWRVMGNRFFLVAAFSPFLSWRAFAWGLAYIWIPEEQKSAQGQKGS